MTTDKPRCELVGTDGNVFALSGRVRDALRKAGQHERAKEFMDKLKGCRSYDEALRLMLEYVEVY